MMLHFCIQLNALKQLLGYYPNLKYSGTHLTFHCEFQVKQVQLLHEQLWKDTLFLFLKQMGDTPN